jgi:hypothetical protein
MQTATWAIKLRRSIDEVLCQLIVDLFRPLKGVNGGYFVERRCSWGSEA